MPLDGSGVYSLPAGNPMPFKLKPLPSSLLNSTFGDLKDALNSRLWKGGGTMTGALTLAGNPSGALDAAPKQYVDLHLPKAGGTLTGALSGTTAAFSGTVSGATATAAGHLVTKAQLDAVAATAGVASFNTRTGAVTLSSSDVTTALGYTPVNKAGDTMTGSLAVQKSDTTIWYTRVTGAAADLKNSRWQHQTDGNIYFGGLNDAETNFTRGIHIPPNGAVAVIGGGTIWHSANFNPGSYAPLASPNFSGTPTVGGASIWHAGNDGAGSGLDADLLDGNQASAFALLSGATFTGAVNGTTFTGSGRLFGNGSSGNNGLGKIIVQAGGTPPAMSQGDICFIY